MRPNMPREELFTILLWIPIEQMANGNKSKFNGGEEPQGSSADARASASSSIRRHSCCVIIPRWIGQCSDVVDCQEGHSWKRKDYFQFGDCYLLSHFYYGQAVALLSSRVIAPRQSHAPDLVVPTVNQIIRWLRSARNLIKKRTTIIRTIAMNRRAKCSMNLRTAPQCR
jgi:hypothetical protein